MNKNKTVWLDIDNPPQVQFLVPFKKELEASGFEVIITARNYGITFQLLKDKDIPFIPVSESFGKTKWAKISGLFRRTAKLVSLIRKKNIAFVISSSRTSAFAARILGIPAYILCDYEFSELKIYRWMGATIVFPRAISHDFFAAKGFSKKKRIQFNGIKEDISFYDIDVDKVAPHHFIGNTENLVLILYRPPAETSHYYNASSGDISMDLLKYLSFQPGIRLIYSPRSKHQVDYLSHFTWENAPFVIDKPIEFISLIKSVDLVISSGGTMLREAAYLNVPAYSIFQSEIGAVDKFLESEGKLIFISSSADYSNIILKKKKIRDSPIEPMPAVKEIINKILLSL